MPRRDVDSSSLALPLARIYTHIIFRGETHSACCIEFAESVANIPLYPSPTGKPSVLALDCIIIGDPPELPSKLSLIYLTSYTES